ncbi:hypothetical protein [Nonomuraea sp. SBT364]|uniref:hypothetical protein n=1 Tax=Nonomuraea sp. SBT364 TaxID=1580530 RepID=UPI00066A1423|nr:hypothetical protein [Nonomuraea sp. SBT364]
MRHTSPLSAALAAARLPPARLPPPGSMVAVARWRLAEGIGAVLSVRHRRDGVPASDVAVAVRSEEGAWLDLGVTSGSGGYPDVFSRSPGLPDATPLGVTETWISDARFRGGAGTSLRLLELQLAGSVTSVVCETASSRAEQEISPLGLCLAGVLGDEPASVHLYRGAERVDSIPLHPAWTPRTSGL